MLKMLKQFNSKISKLHIRTDFYRHIITKLTYNKRSKQSR